MSQKSIRIIVDFLSDHVAKVAVLFYYNVQETHEFIKFLNLTKKKYKMFYWTNNVEVV